MPEVRAERVTWPERIAAAIVHVWLWVHLAAWIWPPVAVCVGLFADERFSWWQIAAGSLVASLVAVALGQWRFGLWAVRRRG